MGSEGDGEGERVQIALIISRLDKKQRKRNRKKDVALDIAKMEDLHLSTSDPQRITEAVECCQILVNGMFGIHSIVAT